MNDDQAERLISALETIGSKLDEQNEQLSEIQIELDAIKNGVYRER